MRTERGARRPNGITNDRWHTVQGGDGFVTIMDQRDWRIVYTESQDGNITRRNRVTGESKIIRPTAGNTTDSQGGGAYRFHWDTPLQWSTSEPNVLLAAGNKVFKSTDRGDSWTAISPDLTTNPVRADADDHGRARTATSASPATTASRAGRRS